MLLLRDFGLPATNRQGAGPARSFSTRECNVMAVLTMDGEAEAKHAEGARVNVRPSVPGPKPRDVRVAPDVHQRSIPMRR